MFGEILQKFVKKTPIAVMVQGLMERLLNAEELDRWFGQPITHNSGPRC